MDNFERLIKEYPEDYCLFLEATYSEGMLSEGGNEALDHMFSGLSLEGQHLLDIGFGLGGATFYLAERYGARVTGIELNSWMVEEATRRTPSHLKNRVDFVSYKNPPLLPFDNNTFDLVYSKGVLVHLNNKLSLFKDVFRVLKSQGLLVIDDWLARLEGSGVIA